MRIFVVLSFLAIAAAGASAQTPTPAPAPAAAPVPPSRCEAIPPAPARPDGATTRDRAVIEQTNEAYRAWGQVVEANLACRNAEIAELHGAAIQHNVRAEEINAEVALFAAKNTEWSAEVGEYMTLHPPRGAPAPH